MIRVAVVALFAACAHPVDHSSPAVPHRPEPAASSDAGSSAQTPTPTPPSRAIVARATNARVQDGATVLTVNAGADKGIERTWKATLVTGDGNPIPGGDCVITEVRDKLTRCAVHATDIVSPHVKLTPP